MAPQEPELELLDLLLGNRHRDEAAEAGIDPVGVLVGDRALDERPRRLHLAASRVGESDRRPVDGDLPHVTDPEVVASERVARDHGSAGRALRIHSFPTGPVDIGGIGRV